MTADNPRVAVAGACAARHGGRRQRLPGRRAICPNTPRNREFLPPPALFARLQRLGLLPIYPTIGAAAPHWSHWIGCRNGSAPLKPP